MSRILSHPTITIPKSISRTLSPTQTRTIPHIISHLQSIHLHHNAPFFMSGEQRSELRALLGDLGIESSKERQRLVRQARSIMRRIHLLQTHDSEDMEVSGVNSGPESAKSMTRAQYLRHIIRSHLEKRMQQDQSVTFNATDISNMCTELAPVLSRYLSRTQFYYMINGEAHKLVVRTRVKTHHRERVREYIEGLRNANDVAWDNIPRICDELQVEIPELPRKSLYTLISHEIFKLQRNLVTEAHREEVRQHVENSTEKNVSPLTEELTPKLPDLPHNVVGELVLREVTRQRREGLSLDDRRAVQERVRESLARNPDIATIDLFTTLQKQFSSTPNRVLNRLVHDEVNRFHRGRVTTEQRKKVRECLSNLEGDHPPIEQLTYQVQNSLNELHMLPPTVVTEIVRRELSRQAKMHTKQLRQVRKQISTFLNDQVSTVNNDLDVSALYETMTESASLQLQSLSKVFALQLIREELRKLATKKLTSDQRKMIRDQTAQHPSLWEDIPQLCDKIAPHLPDDISRDVLYQCVSRSVRVLSRQNSETSEEELSALRQWLSEQMHRSDLENDEELLASAQRIAPNLPKHALLQMIYSATQKMQRNVVTPEIRARIREHILSKGESIRDDLPRLCDELQPVIGSDLSRSTLLYVTREEITKLDKQMLNKVDRSVVKAYIDEHLEDDPPMTIVSVCDALESRVNVPRRALYAYVHQMLLYKRRQQRLKKQRESTGTV